MNPSHSRHEPPYLGPCANCGAEFEGHYCPMCGQEAHIEVPGAAEFLHEFLHHYVALGGAMGATLRILFSKPGQLTVDYLRGVRQRYVRPLRLYLSFSVVFFILQALFGAHDAATVGLGAEGNKEIDVVVMELRQSGPWGHAAGEAIRALGDLASDPQRQERVNALVKRYTPHAMFVLLPAFAALLGLAYRSRRIRYGAHLVFALHFHAVLFAALALDLLPLPRVLSTLIYAGLVAHLGLACLKVYGGRASAMAARLTLLLGSYLAVCGLVLVTGVVAAVFFAQ